MTLTEGHGGIFEVSRADQVIYTNRNQCGLMPTQEEIFGKIRQGPNVKEELGIKSMEAGGGCCGPQSTPSCGGQ